MKSERGWQKRALAGLIGVCVSLLIMAQTAFAGLHFTQAEVNIWRQRAVKGPYKEEWDLIKKRADAFLANPEGRWAGNTTNDCFRKGLHPSPGRIQDRGLRDAGFVYLVTGNTAYRDVVRTQLLLQKNVPGTDWANGQKWCPGGTAMPDNHAVTNWTRRLLYAYSYIRHSLSAADQNALDTWFLNAGNLWEDVIHRLIRTRFPNRLNDDYRECQGTKCPGDTQGNRGGLMYYGGPTVYQFHDAWNNRGWTLVTLFGSIGVLLDNASLKDQAKRFFREWMMFAVWPEGANMDHNRWLDNMVPQTGYAYTVTAAATPFVLADHLARTGDTSLFDFSTSKGMFGTAGGPKSLLKALQYLAGLTNGTIIRYASLTKTTSPDLIIDWDGPDQTVIKFVHLANNIYYNDPSVKQAYTTPLPAKWNSPSYDDRGGDWGSYPGIRFMFGLQENVVWPYPGKLDSSPPSPPRSLRIR